MVDFVACFFGSVGIASISTVAVISAGGGRVGAEGGSGLLVHSFRTISKKFSPFMEINLLLFGLLGKRKRRILILTRWLSQSNGSVVGNSIQETVSRFINLILYEPIRIHLLKDGFRIFDPPELVIYYNWLCSDELAIIKELYLNRLDHFKTRNFYVNDTFHFYGTSTELELPIENRRELVRDYIGLFYGLQKDRDFVNYVMLYVCQQLLLRKGGPDSFIVGLHHALQGRFELKNILCR